MNMNNYSKMKPHILPPTFLRTLAFFFCLLPLANEAATIKNAAPLQLGRFLHTSTLLTDGRVLIAGGLPNTGLTTSGTELLDPFTRSNSLSGSLIAPRNSHTATLLLNGKVLAVGGRSGNTNVLSTELYNPTTGTWAFSGSNISFRIYHTATLLPNGKVLVVGGAPGPVGTNSVELFDPVSSAWTLTGSLNGPRGLHTATLLPNGKVLVGWRIEHQQSLQRGVV
jgi:Kelch motif.